MSNNEGEIIQQNEIKKTEKIDKRKETSRLNMAKAREKKLEKLKEQLDLKKKYNIKDDSESESDEEIIYIPSKKPLKQDSIDDEEEYEIQQKPSKKYFADRDKKRNDYNNNEQMRKELEELKLMLKSKEKQNIKKKVKKVYIEKPSEKQNDEEKPFIKPVEKRNDVDTISEHMRNKILYW